MSDHTVSDHTCRWCDHEFHHREDSGPGARRATHRDHLREGRCPGFPVDNISDAAWDAYRRAVDELGEDCK